MIKLIERLPHRLGWLARRLPGLALALFLPACNTKIPHITPEVRYKPTNIYRRYAVLDSNIKRVALLPMTPLLPTEAYQAGIDSLQPLLHAELEKSKRFEVIVVTSEQLRRWTGQGAWHTDEKLPTDFFDRLHEEIGCDAVFFDQLTRYQPYQPVAIGWKLTLVVNKDRQIYWSADEVFDAGDEAVANAARSYEANHITTQSPLPDPNAILSSPSRFGQYTLEALLSTLPQR
ncbi:MAG TPA: hypothetical protein VH619_05875 [Verrucomicrobiae bacterium]|jgi:hypothetical protein|nr:hypothetical protein [Verrucomicrobiae bacterium]